MNKIIKSTSIILFVLGLSACSHSSKNNTSSSLQTTSSSNASTPTVPPQKNNSSLIYHLMPDRFANGNGNNDGDAQTGLNPTSSQHFHGGDIAGVTQQLDYLAGLGVTQIWLTPIFKNDIINNKAGYHGYWITDFTQLDPHFGTDEELHTLIEEAKNKDIGIILDIVVNHTADIIQYSECDNCAFSDEPYTPVIAEDLKNIKQPQWLNNTALYNLQGNITNESQAITGDLVGLDDLDTRNSIVVQGFIDIYSQWAKQYAISGYRIDTAKHVEPEFWQQWQPAVQSESSKLNIFAEIFDGNPKNIASYLHASTLESALDFGLYYAARDVFAEGRSPQHIADMLGNDYHYNTSAQTKTLKTFVSNHDVGRLGYFIEKNNAEADEEEKISRLIQAYGLLFTVRGTPIIYYGDEQGFIGSGEYEGARDDMFASQVASLNALNTLGSEATTADNNFEQQHPAYITLKALQTLRSEHGALSQGHTTINIADDSGLLIYTNFSVNDDVQNEYVVAFNTQATEQNVTLTGDGFFNRTAQTLPSYSALYSYNNASYTNNTLTLPAYSFTVLKSEAGAEQTFDALSLSAHAKNDHLVFTADAQYTSGMPIAGQVTLYQQTGETFEPILVDHTLPYTFAIPTNALITGASFKAEITYGGDNKQMSAPYTYTATTAPMLIQFKKPADWGNTVNLYFWETQVSAFEPEWPGVVMTPTGDDWYSFEFPEGITAANIIFNDGAQQTDNLSQNQSACYIDTQWLIEDCNAPAPGKTVYVKKPEAWQSPLNIHYWAAGDAPNTQWPGVPMLDLGANWYRFTLPFGATQANMVIHDGNDSKTADLSTAQGQCFDIANEQWSDTCDLTNLVTISGASAHWIDATTLIVMQPHEQAQSYKLLSSDTAAINIDAGALTGAQKSMALIPSELTKEQRDRLGDTHKALATGSAFTFDGDLTEKNTLTPLIQSQLVVAAFDGEAALVSATQVQTALLLDDQYSYAGDLGIHHSTDNTTPTLSVWAPTVQALTLERFDSNLQPIHSQTVEPDSHGVYHFSGDDSWYGQYYRFAITAFHPATNKVEQYSTTDPYSISLSSNSDYSQFINLNNPDLQPANWQALKKTLHAWQDISIYEGHVRDFSAFEKNINKEDQGKYNALTYDGIRAPLSHGMQHLKNLADAGLTHFHLLPVNDIATINEDNSATTALTLEHTVSDACTRYTLEKLAPYCDSHGEMTLHALFTTLTEQDPNNTTVQDIISFARTEQFASVDAFNWGYDPYHFLAPEGSYASNSHGATRILELRNAVSGLNAIGLHTVVDVVFNHTYASGLSNQSVLDKVVPGYYHRRNATSGTVENSTCCDNTAAEHTMMEKLMRDAIVSWAKHYKIDGFRFDLMGHHPKRVMLSIRQALDTLTLEKDGVEGANIYVYGEGWNFGEVSGNQRFEQASQSGLSGTLIGTFNDRLRDGVRGGNFTDTGQAAGFTSGNNVYSEPQSTTATALAQADAIRIGLAGNLMDYTFIDHTDKENTGKGLNNIGYNSSPLENVLYVDKHDNESLWDNTQAKLPATFTAQERVQVQLLSQAFVNYGQGIPFHQMGTDLLRSKSMDRNSFDSGDWFNRIDFSETNDSGINNNWAQGLPPAESNSDRWDTIKTLVDNSNTQVNAQLMRQAHNGFIEQLNIRYSTQLLRLANADDIYKRLQFWNTGSLQTGGLMVMSISGSDCATEKNRTFEHDGLLIAFNASNTTQSWQDDALSALPFTVHPLQNINPGSFDSTTGIFTLPPISASVFILPKGSAGALPCNPLQTSPQTPGITVYAKAPASWAQSLYIHYWETSPAETQTQWPGDSMLSIGEGWFSATLPSNTNNANIIFNDNNGNQTSDLYRDGDGCFDIENNLWQPACSLPGITVSFIKPDHWSNAIRAYTWENSSSENLEWPGQLMEENDGVFQIKLPAGVRASKIIFNDVDGTDASGEQTPDLFIDHDSCYSSEKNWHAC